MKRLSQLVLSVTVLAACDVPQPTMPPPEDPAWNLSSASDRPFYDHQGEPIYLRPDYTRVVVARAENLPDQPGAVREVLEAFGLSVAGREALRQVARHDVFSLTGESRNAAAAIAALRLQPGIVFATPSYTLEEGTDTLLLVNELVVHFADGIGRASIDSLVEAMGASIARPPRPEYGFEEYRLAYPPTADPLAVAAQLSRDPLVEWVDPNKIGSLYPGLASPSDPYYGLQYYFKAPTAPWIDINIEPAWDITLGGGVPSAGGIRVSVIDDGVEAAHPDFAGQVETSFDWDAITGNHNRASSPSCALDSHGTNVTGMIVGQHDNGEGVAGGAPGARVVPIRIYSQCEGLASDADVADAIAWAWYWTDSHVLSNSWRWPHVSNAITNEINQAVANGRDGKGATVVFAAGNVSNRDQGIFNGMTYPGYLASVIGVGAIDRNGDPADYTPRDSRLDIVALSGANAKGSRCDSNGDVVTTELTGTGGCDDGPNGDQDYTSRFTGTSASAPQVAVAAALLYSADGSLTGSAVRSKILGSAAYWGRSDDFGAGKLNVGAALRLTASISGPSFVYANQTQTWSATVSGGFKPYDYTWFRDGQIVSTSTSYSGNTGSSDFQLQLEVTDALNASAGDDLYVTVNSCPPPQITC